jgi:hypothetical protein
LDRVLTQSEPPKQQDAARDTKRHRTDKLLPPDTAEIHQAADETRRGASKDCLTACFPDEWNVGVCDRLVPVDGEGHACTTRAQVPSTLTTTTTAATGTSGQGRSSFRLLRLSLIADLSKRAWLYSLMQREVARGTKRDSSAMKSISLLTMMFLPATAIPVSHFIRTPRCLSADQSDDHWPFCEIGCQR